MVDELENTGDVKKTSKKNMKTLSGNKIKKTNKSKKSLGIKRATSGYLLFIRSERLALTRADPSLSLGELGTQVGYMLTILYCNVLYCNVLYCTLLCCIVVNC